SRPVNLESQEAYMRGHYHWARMQPARSIEHFQQAIAIDPDNAAAYSGMADAQCMLFGAALQVVPPTQLAPMARSAALKALELDESLAEPHVTLARVLFWHDRDPIGAERELHRAIQLNPNCTMAHFHFGMLFADLGRSSESVVALQRALQLDPVSCWNSTIAGMWFYELGREEAGKQELHKALDLDPNFFFTRTVLAGVHLSEGRSADAIAAAEEGVRLSGGLPAALGWAAYYLAMGGRQADAIAILDRLEELSRERHVPASARVWAYVGLGEYERAIEWLEIAYLQRDSHLPHVGAMRAFKPLHSDPRFQDLLRRLGLRQ
ncbi:MAG TPA: tetratricopeptide repeat protein, partial [Longimicrobiales bacterium]|nr:tetratricopeptide repeat protein [Longimicrobiales bacterium]